MMQQPVSAKISVLVAVSTLLLLIAGCAAVRKVTYPADFIYISKQEVRTSMQQLALGLDRLNGLLSETDANRPETREHIIAELKNMEATAQRLGSGTSLSNHPFIDDNIDEFKNQVTQARKAVEDEPPTYFHAGRLVGGCMSCHKLR